MEARIAYRKLMLYDNITHSDNKRVIKEIMMVQQQENREGTWLKEVNENATYVGIKDSYLFLYYQILYNF